MKATPDPTVAGVPHVGTYRRLLPVSLERLYENALDWEHLPWLHNSSFCDIDCLDAGDWGWRARVGVPPVEQRIEITIELRLDRDCRRWITRNLDGPTQGAEIWTHAFQVSERETDIVVDFFVPGTPADQVESVGDFYKAVYHRLYDEDVSMMVERQKQLDLNAERASKAAEAITLGPLREVRERLPITVEQGGMPYRVIELDGRLTAYSLVCPHSLGPLDAAEVVEGTVECPWHGYRFDVRSGEPVGSHKCRLARAPEVRVNDDSSAVTVEPLARR